MRFSPAAVALSLTLAMLSSVSVGKKPDVEISAQSVALVKAGDEAMRASKPAEAIDWYQSALAVDPRNRDAYVAMARAVKSQGLDGKAIGFYRLALELDPNDQIALSEQGAAMASKGAVEQAKANLARLKMLCKNECASADQLAVAITKASEKPTLQASAVEIKPVVGEQPKSQPN